MEIVKHHKSDSLRKWDLRKTLKESEGISHGKNVPEETAQRPCNWSRLEYVKTGKTQAQMAKANGALCGKKGHKDGRSHIMDERAHGKCLKLPDWSILSINLPLSLWKSLICLDKLNDLLSSIGLLSSDSFQTLLFQTRIRNHPCPQGHQKIVGSSVLQKHKAQWWRTTALEAWQGAPSGQGMLHHGSCHRALAWSGSSGNMCKEWKVKTEAEEHPHGSSDFCSMQWPPHHPNVYNDCHLEPSGCQPHMTPKGKAAHA